MVLHEADGILGKVKMTDMDILGLDILFSFLGWRSNHRSSWTCLPGNYCYCLWCGILNVCQKHAMSRSASVALKFVLCCCSQTCAFYFSSNHRQTLNVRFRTDCKGPVMHFRPLQFCKTGTKEAEVEEEEGERLPRAGLRNRVQLQFETASNTRVLDLHFPSP